MFESDKNMLRAIDFLKESGDIKFKITAYEVMDISAENIWKIKNADKLKQSNHFTVEQIRLFCKHFKINSNYIFGLESNIYLK